MSKPYRSELTDEELRLYSEDKWWPIREVAQELLGHRDRSRQASENHDLAAERGERNLVMSPPEWEAVRRAVARSSAMFDDDQDELPAVLQRMGGRPESAPANEEEVVL